VSGKLVGLGPRNTLGLVLTELKTLVSRYMAKSFLGRKLGRPVLGSDV